MSETDMTKTEIRTLRIMSCNDFLRSYSKFHFYSQIIQLARKGVVKTLNN